MTTVVIGGHPSVQLAGKLGRGGGGVSVSVADQKSVEV